jgi:mRNA interferase MazF
MARTVRRGEVWLYTFRKPDKQRPVVIMTRDEVIPLLQTVTVAPVTSTIYGAPGEVIIGPDEGLKHKSAMNLDHLQTVSKKGLHTFLGTIKPEKMPAVCRALGIALGCLANAPKSGGSDDDS